MLKLHGRAWTALSGPSRVLRVTRNPAIVDGRSRHALWVDGAGTAQREGFGAILSVGPGAESDTVAVALPPDLAYLDEGDIIRVDPKRQYVNVLYRRSSRHNTLLVTEQCNSRCLMCSQPPVLKPDGYLIEDLLEAVPLMARDTPELIVSGGEPALLHDRLIQLLTSMRDHLPDTAVHLLSNGRLFSYLQYAAKLASVDHHDLMVGIPLYGDTSDLHDFVVQANGAFDQTLRGIMNLGRYRQPVEIRVVIHRQTYQRLPQLARFIARNLPFVSHVALMGLEVTGYTRLNLEALWIDPFEYQGELQEAVALLDESGLNTSIYNHQLCLLDESLWPFARQSISDWKNEYLPDCETCAVRSQCGGFFATGSIRTSSYISPIASVGAFSS